MNKLSNAYEVRGKNLVGLKNTLESLDKRTSVITVDGKDIVVCHIPDKKYYKTSDGIIKEKEINKKEDILKTGSISINLFYPDEKKMFVCSESGCQSLKTAKLNIKKLMDSEYPEAFVSEILKTKTMFFINGKYCLLSDMVDATLYQRIDMHGRSITEHTLTRDLHIAELLRNAGKCKVIIRSENNVHKIISIMSSRFNYIPQSMIMNIINGIDPKRTLGNPDVYYWAVNNINTEVALEFPEKAKEFCETYGIKDDIVPGLLISKSDVGFGAIRVAGTWRINKSLQIFDSVSRKHSGDFDYREIVDEAGRKLFGEFSLLPEKLCELMMENITDPTWFESLPHEEAMAKNLDRCCNVIKSVFTEIELTKAIQKKREKIIYEELCNNIDPELNYTAYDICMMIMDVPSRVSGLNKDYEEMLKIAIGKAPYVNYKGRKIEVMSIA